MDDDSKSVHVIAEIDVSELCIHIYYISIYNESESSWNYIEQGLKQWFNLDVVLIIEIILSKALNKGSISM